MTKAIVQHRLIWIVATTVPLSVGGCDKPSPPPRSSTPQPTQTATAAASPSAPVDETALASDFVAFSKRFISHANKLHPTEEFSIESSDVERTASVLQPLRGKLVARMKGKEPGSNDFRITYWFDRAEGKWSPTQPEIEVVRRGRGFSVELVEQMKQLERRKAESMTILAYKDAGAGG